MTLTHQLLESSLTITMASTTMTWLKNLGYQEATNAMVISEIGKEVDGVTLGLRMVLIMESQIIIRNHKFSSMDGKEVMILLSKVKICVLSV